MPLRALVKPGFYKDSVALMRLSETLAGVKGVSKATVVMATPANKAILKDAELLAPEVAAAKPDDLVAVVDGIDVRALDAAFETLAALLAERKDVGGAGGAAEIRPRAVAQAATKTPGATLALISVPGPFAAAEALKAIRLGLDALVFSDNVPLAEERAIKDAAHAKGRLVMGPDCGTAIIGGVPLGFANVVRRGRIGLVAASGTGLQQATCLIDRLGEGVSHAIGTGGRDMSDAVGGISMIDGLRMLAADPGTSVIVAMAKPPAPKVAEAILDAAAGIKKPVVVNFLGADASALGGRKGLHFAETLEDAATVAVAVARGRKAPKSTAIRPSAAARSDMKRLKASQTGIRALFSGGTFRAEAEILWRKRGVALGPPGGGGHWALDLGDDEFTLGKPHPMIDPASRIERIRALGADGTAAVLLLDVVLGHGSHMDPAGALVPAIAAAKAAAKRKGRVLPVVAFVCGTEADPQRLSDQEAKLRAAGVHLERTSTRAARLAALFVERRK